MRKIHTSKERNECQKSCGEVVPKSSFSNTFTCEKDISTTLMKFIYDNRVDYLTRNISYFNLLPCGCFYNHCKSYSVWLVLHLRFNIQYKLLMKQTLFMCYLYFAGCDLSSVGKTLEIPVSCYYCKTSTRSIIALTTSKTVCSHNRVLVPCPI